MPRDCLSSLKRAQQNNRPGELVLLTHGFMAHRWMLTPLSHRLSSTGWDTRCWGYESWITSVSVHAQAFADVLEDIDCDHSVTTVHLVTHSMGCIIARAALPLYHPKKLGRFVMLAPPNRGSFIATATATLLGRFLQPVSELTTDASSFVNKTPQPSNVEIGIIAASRDALVAVDATRLDVPHQHVTIPCLHSSLLFRRDSAKLVSQFLDSGKFASINTPHE